MTCIEDTLDGWSRPIRLDDWGSVHWYLKIVESAAGTRSHSDQDPSDLLKPGDSVEVQWPDGTVSVQVLGAGSTVYQVSDHGPAYDVRSEQLYVDIPHRGMGLQVTNLSNIRLRRRGGRNQVYEP